MGWIWTPKQIVRSTCFIIAYNFLSLSVSFADGEKIKSDRVPSASTTTPKNQNSIAGSSVRGGLKKSKVQRCKDVLEDEVGALEKSYTGLKDLKGEFKQVYSDAVYHRDNTSYGYAYFRRGGMMRWDYASPEKKAFVSDGKVLSVWEAESNQVIRNDLSEANFSTGLEFLVGEVKIRDRFTVSCANESDAKKIGSINEHVLMLRPKIPQASFEYLLVIVDNTSRLIREAMLVGDFGSNYFLFSNLKKNTKLSEQRFHFRVPKGARTIEASAISPKKAETSPPITPPPPAKTPADAPPATETTVPEKPKPE